MPAQILELFPLHRLGQRSPEPSQIEARAAKLKAVHECLIVRKPWPEGANGEKKRVKRAGELYKRYRKLEELPEAARPFFELAGKLILIFGCFTRPKPGAFFLFVLARIEIWNLRLLTFGYSLKRWCFPEDAD